MLVLVVGSFPVHFSNLPLTNGTWYVLPIDAAFIES